MMDIVQQNNSYDIQKIKLELKKYCYVNASTKFEQDRLRVSIHTLIDSCNDNDLLITIYNIFDKCIRCYFMDYRTEFNKIRSMFMMSVMNSLLLQETSEIFIKLVRDSYETWCNYSFTNYDDYCISLKEKAIEYLKSL